MVYDNATSSFYRFSKDERPNGNGPGQSANGKFIFQESSPTFAGPWKLLKSGIGKGAMKQGEGPLVFHSNANQQKVHVPTHHFNIADGP
jgi:hypothetical protein